MHELRRAVVARTNNPLQRFNRELNAAFDTPHPSLIRLVQTIVEISRRYVKLRDDIARSIASPPRRDMQPDLPTPVNLPENYDEEDVHSDQRDSVTAEMTSPVERTQVVTVTVATIRSVSLTVKKRLWCRVGIAITTAVNRAVHLELRIAVISPCELVFVVCEALPWHSSRTEDTASSA